MKLTLIEDLLFCNCPPQCAEVLNFPSYKPDLAQKDIFDFLNDLFY